MLISCVLKDIRSIDNFERRQHKLIAAIELPEFS